MKRYPRAFSWIFALAIAFASEIAWAQELEKVVIGHSSLRNDIAFLWVPKELGIFRKYGLEPTIEIMGLRNPNIAQLKPEDLVDVTILQRLEQSGFMR